MPATSVKKLYGQPKKGDMPPLRMEQEEWHALQELMRSGFHAAYSENPDKRQLYDKVADKVQAVVGTDPFGSDGAEIVEL